MYKNLASIAKTIVDLSNKRDAQKQVSNTLKLVSLSDFEISKEFVEISNQMEEVLMNLNLDEILALQAIMYLGRDKISEKKSPDEIFFSRLKMVKSLSHDPKEIEIHYMIEKPLGEYFTEGYKILGINL